MNAAPDPIAPFLAGGGTLVLDGGLATELEKAGFDLDHPLWSARVLRDAPDGDRRGASRLPRGGSRLHHHRELPGQRARFRARGPLCRSRSGSSCGAACGSLARLATRSGPSPGNRVGRNRPLVAASLGPYGAYLANGAEYTGDYDLDEQGLVAFHRERFRCSPTAQADLLACETIPSAAKARALLGCSPSEPAVQRLAQLQLPGRRAPLRRHGPCRGRPTRGGRTPQVLAVGVNCTAPEHVEALLRGAAPR